MKRLKGKNEAVLTRAARKKAGLPPPSPLYRGVPRSLTDGNNLTHHSDSDCLSSSDVKTSSDGSTQKSLINIDTKNLKKSLNLESDTEALSKLRSQKLLTSKGRISSSESDSSDDESGVRPVWVQCDHIECGKWRGVPPNTVINQLEPWYCSMHPEGLTCDLPEESWIVSKKRAFTFTRLDPGALVWAKMATYPKWPAVISPDPWSEMNHMSEEREGCIYHVEFLGKTHSHLWIQEEKIEPYRSRSNSTHSTSHQSSKCRIKGHHGNQGCGKSKQLAASTRCNHHHQASLQQAVSEAENLLKLSNKERLEQCVFRECKGTPRYNGRATGHRNSRQRTNLNKRVKTEVTEFKQSYLTKPAAVSSKGQLKRSSSGTTITIADKKQRGPKQTNTAKTLSAQLLQCLKATSSQVMATLLLQSLQSQLINTMPETATSSATGNSSTVNQPSGSAHQITCSNLNPQLSKPMSILSQSDSPHSTAALKPACIVPTIITHNHQQGKRNTKQKRANTHSVESSSQRSVSNPNKPAGQTGGNPNTQKISPRLIQAHLGREASSNRVQVVPVVPSRVKRGGRGGRRRGHRASVGLSRSPTIEEYFTRGQKSDLTNGERNIGTVPSTSPMLETETKMVESELQEIQDLLSTFTQSERTVNEDTPSDSHSIGSSHNIKISRHFPTTAVLTCTPTQQKNLDSPCPNKERVQNKQVTACSNALSESDVGSEGHGVIGELNSSSIMTEEQSSEMPHGAGSEEDLFCEKWMDFEVFSNEEFDSALNELQCIEDLIQVLGDQEVPLL